MFFLAQPVSFFKSKSASIERYYERHTLFSR